MHFLPVTKFLHVHKGITSIAFLFHLNFHFHIETALHAPVCNQINYLSAATACDMHLQCQCHYGCSFARIHLTFDDILLLFYLNCTCLSVANWNRLFYILKSLGVYNLPSTATACREQYYLVSPRQYRAVPCNYKSAH